MLVSLLSLLIMLVSCPVHINHDSLNPLSPFPPPPPPSHALPFSPQSSFPQHHLSVSTNHEACSFIKSKEIFSSKCSDAKSCLVTWDSFSKPCGHISIIAICVMLGTVTDLTITMYSEWIPIIIIMYSEWIPIILLIMYSEWIPIIIIMYSEWIPIILIMYRVDS